MWRATLPKACKSWLGLEMAVSVASATPCLGTFPVREPGGVLIYLAEDSLEAVGGPETWELGGAFNCGKAQPGQVASVSHGCPTSLFRNVRILNTTEEAGH